MRERELVLMECKLGALLDRGNSSLTFEGNTGAFNLNYQFGRKDPFPLNGTNGSTSDTFYTKAVDAKMTGSAIQIIWIIVSSILIYLLRGIIG